MLRRPPVERAVLLVLVGALFAISCLDQPTGSTPPQHPTPEPAVPVHSAIHPSVAAEMHLHGWTNHSANSHPASIMWHTLQYADAGVGVMWWTDHAEFFSRHYPDLVVTTTQSAQVDPLTWTVGSWGPGNAGVVVVRFDGSGGGVVVLDSSRVAIRVPTAADSNTAELAFGILVEGRFVRAPFGALARPLVGDPRFRFTVWRDATTGRFPDLDLVVPLAWHPLGDVGFREVLRYRYSDAPIGTPLSGKDTVEIRRTWPAGDSAFVELAPLSDAAPFADALDNTTDQYLLHFSRPPGVGSMSFILRVPRIVNQVTGAAAQLAAATALAHAAGAALGVHEIFGIELGLDDPALVATAWDSVSGAGRHLAVYFPGDIAPGFVDSIPANGEPARFITGVHSAGGIVSIAHPFGTQISLPTASEGVQQQQTAGLGSFLVQQGAWGADLIEVGYWVRGEHYIQDHMNLLDYLLANGLHICGVAATDSHGGYVLQNPALGTEDEYNFVTWIGSADRSTSPAGLIASLRACDESFGDPFYVHGGMWIAIHSDSTGQVLDLDLDGVSPSAQFLVYEAEIDSTGTPHAPVYRSFGKVVPRVSRLVVGGCRSGFVRLEAWYGTRPLGFSNVAEVAPEPSKCTGSAPRAQRAPKPPA